MFRFVRNIFSIERDSRFVARILFLSAPTALVFMVLVLLKLSNPLLAIISLASVVVFNLLMLFPITFELQQIRKYVFNLAAAVADIALDAAHETLVCVCVHKDFQIHLVTKLLILKNKDTLYDNNLLRLYKGGICATVVYGIIVYGNLNRNPGLEQAYMLHQHIGVKGRRMVVV